MNELTNDAKFLITFMYAKYLEKIKEGTPKEEARNFQSIDYIQEHIMPEWSRDDVLDTCRELSRHSYVNGTFGNNDFYRIFISTEAIAALEQKFQKPTFKERIESALDFAGKVKAAIPFI